MAEISTEIIGLGAAIIAGTTGIAAAAIGLKVLPMGARFLSKLFKSIMN